MIKHKEKKSSPELQKYTLRRLENMLYRIDRENAIRYAELCRHKTPQPRWFSYLVWRLIGSDAHKPIKFMWWRNIVRLADYAGVPAEILVDEDHYFRKYGVAGYRLLFEAHRRGISLAELTDIPDKETQTERSTNMWFKTWYDLLKGFNNSSISSRILPRVLRAAYQRIGMPMGTLLGSQVHSAEKAIGVHGELTSAITSLGRRECAFLAGAAKSISHYYTNRDFLDEKVLAEDMSKLLGWYCGKERANTG